MRSENQLCATLFTLVSCRFDLVGDILADHAVKIAGIDRVGIGSDFDSIAATGNGLEDVSKTQALVAVLLKRGSAESDLEKILGLNHLRVVREVTGN